MSVSCHSDEQLWTNHDHPGAAVQLRRSGHRYAHGDTSRRMLQSQLSVATCATQRVAVLVRSPHHLVPHSNLSPGIVGVRYMLLCTHKISLDEDVVG